MIRHVFTGFKFADPTPDDCPNMRQNAQEGLTARLRRVASPDARSFAYEGIGRFSADIDGCGKTPDRKLSGTSPSDGAFLGDQFLTCKVTVVAPARDVRVRFYVWVGADGKTQSIQMRWEPVGTVAAPSVTSSCEPQWHASHVEELTKEYRRDRFLEITDPDLLQGMAPGGKLNPGTYEDPEGSLEGRWQLTVTQGR